MKWEPIDSSGSCNIDRAKVPGGWLVRMISRGHNGESGLAFVPDPQHTWDGKSVNG
ncbi:MAG: hypothetical protein K8M05_24980 [Deltaproteobacteria bacterium]|nr:hypothetical protein [Kofleriaceae bacterium]